ncbi:hypothetical protein HELRODRAFT_170154 [Helobdella robusta]|uniref:Uncharacterized protein n=1 Tax=Helobdella robusta TaxID=6412 RepID=T1F2Q2_HELRO|nr:hypothetical protein HELRODRAFT_170154 [Helobdella robusta]ESO07610.1 hypothetical protein HELRODRAFT_170154 [Helobdella robusta]
MAQKQTCIEFIMKTFGGVCKSKHEAFQTTFAINSEEAGVRARVHRCHFQTNKLPDSILMIISCGNIIGYSGVTTTINICSTNNIYTDINNNIDNINNNNNLMINDSTSSNSKTNQQNNIVQTSTTSNPNYVSIMATNKLNNSIKTTNKEREHTFTMFSSDFVIEVAGKLFSERKINTTFKVYAKQKCINQQQHQHLQQQQHQHQQYQQHQQHEQKQDPQKHQQNFCDGIFPGLIKQVTKFNQNKDGDHNKNNNHHHSSSNNNNNNSHKNNNNNSHNNINNNIINNNNSEETNVTSDQIINSHNNNNNNNNNYNNNNNHDNDNSNINDIYSNTFSRTNNVHSTHSQSGRSNNITGNNNNENNHNNTSSFILHDYNNELINTLNNNNNNNNNSSDTNGPDYWLTFDCSLFKEAGSYDVFVEKSDGDVVITERLVTFTVSFQDDGASVMLMWPVVSISVESLEYTFLEDDVALHVVEPSFQLITCTSQHFNETVMLLVLFHDDQNIPHTLVYNETVTRHMNSHVTKHVMGCGVFDRPGYYSVAMYQSMDAHNYPGEQLASTEIFSILPSASTVKLLAPSYIQNVCSHHVVVHVIKKPGCCCLRGRVRLYKVTRRVLFGRGVGREPEMAGALVKGNKQNTRKLIPLEDVRKVAAAGWQMTKEIYVAEVVVSRAAVQVQFECDLFQGEEDGDGAVEEAGNNFNDGSHQHFDSQPAHLLDDHKSIEYENLNNVDTENLNTNKNNSNDDDDNDDEKMSRNDEVVGYCWRYVSIARDGSVHHHAITCSHVPQRDGEEEEDEYENVDGDYDYDAKESTFFNLLWQSTATATTTTEQQFLNNINCNVTHNINNTATNITFVANIYKNKTTISCLQLSNPKTMKIKIFNIFPSVQPAKCLEVTVTNISNKSVSNVIFKRFLYLSGSFFEVKTSVKARRIAVSFLAHPHIHEYSHPCLDVYHAQGEMNDGLNSSRDVTDGDDDVIDDVINGDGDQDVTSEEENFVSSHQIFYHLIFHDFEPNFDVSLGTDNDNDLNTTNNHNNNNSHNNICDKKDSVQREHSNYVIVLNDETNALILITLCVVVAVAAVLCFIIMKFCYFSGQCSIRGKFNGRK